MSKSNKVAKGFLYPAYPNYSTTTNLKISVNDIFNENKKVGGEAIHDINLNNPTYTMHFLNTSEVTMQIINHNNIVCTPTKVSNIDSKKIFKLDSEKKGLYIVEQYKQKVKNSNEAKRLLKYYESVDIVDYEKEISSDILEIINSGINNDIDNLIQTSKTIIVVTFISMGNIVKNKISYLPNVNLIIACGNLNQFILHPDSYLYKTKQLIYEQFTNINTPNKFSIELFTSVPNMKYYIHIGNEAHTIISKSDFTMATSATIIIKREKHETRYIRVKEDQLEVFGLFKTQKESDKKKGVIKHIKLESPLELQVIENSEGAVTASKCVKYIKDIAGYLTAIDNAVKEKCLLEKKIEDNNKIFSGILKQALDGKKGINDLKMIIYQTELLDTDINYNREKTDEFNKLLKDGILLQQDIINKTSTDILKNSLIEFEFNIQTLRSSYELEIIKMSVYINNLERISEVSDSKVKSYLAIFNNSLLKMEIEAKNSFEFEKFNNIVKANKIKLASKYIDLLSDTDKRQADVITKDLIVMEATVEKHHRARMELKETQHRKRLEIQKHNLEHKKVSLTEESNKNTEKHNRNTEKHNSIKTGFNILDNVVKLANTFL